jgi:adenylosuccinate lyase
MIPRYKVQKIHDIWKTDNKLDTWLKVELAHLKSLLNDNVCTHEEYDDIINNVSINKDRWQEIESVTKHDLQAFIQMLEESIPNNSGRWIHYGLTSSDVIDTSNILMCIQTLNVILEYGVMIQNTVSVLIKSDKAGSKILARTHGKSAEVQTYRNIFNRWSNSLYSAFKLVRETKEKLAVGKLSGVSGNNIQNPYAREVNALRQLNLYPTSCSQIIPRTVFLDYFYAILKVVLAVEKIAYDIRMYSIDGINEMSEPFTKGQKGSSAMPHKKNPILTENICGLTRLYKSYFNTAIENCTTLFERDISHSSSERIIFKDAGHISCFTLKRLNEVLLGINLHTDNAQINCDKVKESISAQSKMMDNISCGLSRKESHDIQQEKSFIV